MAPKKSKISKAVAALKKAGTMAATAIAGQEFLKKAWGEDKLNRVNELLEARDKSDTSGDSDEAGSSAAVATTTDAVAAASTSTKAKPKLSKARTMKNTAKEGKALIGKEVLGDTRTETKRRQAAVNAKKVLQTVSKPSAGRKPALKRLGTMAKTAREGKAYVKRTNAGKKTKGKTAGARGKKAKK